MAVQAAPLINWGGAAPQAVAVLASEGEVNPVPSNFTVLAAPRVSDLALLSAGHAL